MRKAFLALLTVHSICMAKPIQIINKAIDEQYPVAKEPYENILAKQEASAGDSFNAKPSFDHASEAEKLETGEKQPSRPPIRAKQESPVTFRPRIENHVPQASALPKSPASEMTRSQISHVANTCQDKINQMWVHRTQIPRDRMANFQRAIGEAQRACKHVQKVNSELKQADEDVRSFDESMLVAQKQY